MTFCGRVLRAVGAERPYITDQNDAKEAAVSDTDWIVKGAKVVVLHGYDGHAAARIEPAWIEKVNKRTFKLHGDDAKYDVASQREQTGSVWASGAIVVRSGDSRIERLRQRIAVSRAKSSLHSSYEAVRREPTREGLAQLIQDAHALDALLAED